MGKSVLRSSVKGAIMGASMTGGWLLADLLLPEPWGDVILFSAMAVANIGIGWKLGRMFDQKEAEAEAAAAAGEEAAKARSAAEVP
ncbi:hypothetical protein COLU111180_20125 [Cohnella lubricantis]|uniref:Uncharacterized protein n=1 Tax=Cohnella lubricantis TaxID=2163172 RepID=A0A841TKR6_9BACL|nr:hypothetical protein [Cohnella lubricantis]MBB6679111.1 hypothetical protein [Cohnella lubricantis]MBP2119647.1 membrane protein implicated in regulation of membrane protease activity [Cohnella lubricantis]